MQARARGWIFFIQYWSGVSELENEIDQIVYLLYNHTADEIAIVEEAME